MENMVTFGVPLEDPTLVLYLGEVSFMGLLSVREALKGSKFERLNVILQTPGGAIDPAFQITKLLRCASDHLSIYVPLYAKSAGTLIALSADEIVMGDLSQLGPLDTQIQETQKGDGPQFKSALNGFKALEQVQRHSVETWDVLVQLIIQRAGLTLEDAIRLASDYTGQTSGQLYSKMDPHRIGEYSRALEIGEEYGKEILRRFLKWPEAKVNKVVEMLVKNYPSHGYVLDAEEVKKLGLNVSYRPYQEFEPYEQFALHLEEMSKAGKRGQSFDLVQLLLPKPVERVVTLEGQLQDAIDLEGSSDRKSILKKTSESERLETPSTKTP